MGMRRKTGISLWQRFKALIQTPLRAFGNIVTIVFGSAKANRPNLIKSEAEDSLAYIYSIVFSCINKRASEVANAVWELRDANDEVVEATSGAAKVLMDLLNKPWDVFSGDDFLYLCQGYIDACGEVFIFVERDGRGAPIGLAPLRPDRMDIKIDSAGDVVDYEFSSNSTIVHFLPEEIIHIRRVSLTSPLRGASIIRAAGYEITEHREMHDSRIGLLENDSTPPYALVPRDNIKITPEQADALRESIRSRHSGSSQKGNVLILSGAVDPVPLPVNHAELFYLAEIGATEKAIARTFGVPMALLGDIVDFNRANAEAAQAIFLKQTVEPECGRIASNLTEAPQLLAALGLVGYTLVLVLDIPRDRVFVLDMAVKGVTTGFLTRNEARELFGYEKISTPDADALFTPALSIPIRATETAPKARKGFDRDRLGSYARSVASKQIAFEKSFKRIMDDWFDGQSRFIRSRLGKALKAQSKDVVIDSNIDPVSEGLRLAKLLSPEVLAIMESFFYDTLGFSDSQISAVFSPNSPIASAWIGDGFKQRCITINETTKEIVEAQLREGLAAGEGIDKISQRVADAMGEMKSYRSERIARTEVIGASNTGQFDALKAMQVERKQWVSGTDDRVRDTHVAADGQIVGIDDPFDVGGALLMYPGDTAADAPGETINCRCTFVPYFEEGE